MPDAELDPWGDFPPTQSLVLEVLAARDRLGEPWWSFGARHLPAIKALTERGLVEWRNGNLYRVYLAWLTESGRAAMLSETYKPPSGYTFTRPALVDALTQLELKVALTGRDAGKINAESMADAIIEALGCAAAPQATGDSGCE